MTGIKEGPCIMGAIQPVGVYTSPKVKANMALPWNKGMNFMRVVDAVWLEVDKITIVERGFVKTIPCTATAISQVGSHPQAYVAVTEEAGQYYETYAPVVYKSYDNAPSDWRAWVEAPGTNPEIHDLTDQELVVVMGIAEGWDVEADVLKKAWPLRIHRRLKIPRSQWQSYNPAERWIPFLWGKELRTPRITRRRRHVSIWRLEPWHLYLTLTGKASAVEHKRAVYHDRPAAPQKAPVERWLFRSLTDEAQCDKLVEVALKLPMSMWASCMRSQIRPSSLANSAPVQQLWNVISEMHAHVLGLPSRPLPADLTKWRHEITVAVQQLDTDRKRSSSGRSSQSGSM
jgi:hypothetical protein